MKLSSFNARVVPARCEVRQPLHTDSASIVDGVGTGFWVCNCLVLLDDYDEVAGGIRLVPGSHRWGQLPANAMADPHDAHPQEILVTAAAGSLLVTNSHVWHGGMPNRSGGTKLAFHVYFTRRDKPQQTFQEQMIAPETLSAMTPLARWVCAIEDEENHRAMAAAAAKL